MLWAMSHSHLRHTSTWQRHWGTLVVGVALLTGCSLQGPRGGAGNAPANLAAPPPGGMGPGAAVVLSPTPQAAATATSAPIVAVATVVQPPPTAVPPTATNVPAPPPVLAAHPLPTATVAVRATPRIEPSPRATARPALSATPRRSATPAATPHLVTYVVKKGDDVYAIARRFSVTPALIISTNGLKEPSKIKIGQTLHIPVVGSGVPTS